MNILGFNFLSKEDKQKKLNIYKKKMYPLGDAQLEWEHKMVDDIFKDCKKDIEYIKYSVIYYRQKIRKPLDDEIDEFDHSDAKWKSLLSNLRIKDEYVPIIEVMSELENNANSLEELPTKEDILNEVEKRK